MYAIELLQCIIKLVFTYGDRVYGSEVDVREFKFTGLMYDGGKE
jgi:hypothetical protein